jgi:hypothetical protein
VENPLLSAFSNEQLLVPAGVNDGQKIKYEMVRDQKSGKMSADQLSTD